MLNDYNDCQNENRVVDKYYCKYCDAHLARKFNFDRHILTAKHLKFKNDYKIVINESGEKVFIKNEIFECKCGKTYKHSTNLIRHKKTNCVLKNENKDIIIQNALEHDKDNNINYKEIILTLINENIKLKNKLTEIIENIDFNN